MTYIEKTQSKYTYAKSEWWWLRTCRSRVYLKSYGDASFHTFFYFFICSALLLFTCETSLAKHFIFTTYVFPCNSWSTQLSSHKVSLILCETRNKFYTIGYPSTYRKKSTRSLLKTIIYFFVSVSHLCHFIRMREVRLVIFSYRSGKHVIKRYYVAINYLRSSFPTQFVSATVPCLFMLKTYCGNERHYCILIAAIILKYIFPTTSQKEL